MTSDSAMRWTPAPERDAEQASPENDENAPVLSAEDGFTLLDRAGEAYAALVNVLPDGTHHIVACAHGNEPLIECQTLEVLGAAVALASDDSVNVCCVLATAMAASAGRLVGGGIVVRTIERDGTEWVRGWSIQGGWLEPVQAADIRVAYESGGDGPIEAEYRQGEDIPTPDGADAEERCRRRHPANRPPNRRN
ncbi:hypothetical protein [Streptomyces sp. NPDC004286]|uniref:hypothetical protein n=1 Tax=Streptomyces sp. NPDC004286 TaxID=3364696 RepID=UPI00367CB74E